MQRVYVKTMGCKVNTFDSQAIREQFAQTGAQIVNDPTRCDVAVVNSCSVTANADKEARYFARRLRRLNPEALVVFTGCYAQTDSATLAAMEEVDLVVPNEIKENLVSATQTTYAKRQEGEKNLPKVPEGAKPVKDNRQGHFKSASAFFDHTYMDQTRAFIKIQDGCNGFCTYCLIPYARGASRAVPETQVLAEVDRLLAAGILEIVLTGIHVGDYGRHEEDSPAPYPLAQLVAKILQREKLQRLRISSLEPSEVRPELMSVLKDHQDKVCQHWHLPLQSGSDPVLKRMGRSYDTATYRSAVQRVREVFPEASIGADMIPGFPGETAEDFAASLKFVEELNLTYLHVFPYSKRPQTAAMRFPNHVSQEVIKDRSRVLRQWSDEALRRYQKKFLGRQLEVLWEEDFDQQGRRLGTTSNYLKVACSEMTPPPPGTLSRVQIKGFTESKHLLGIIKSEF